MPLVQIDCDRALADQRLKISEKVHQAFVGALGVCSTENQRDDWYDGNVHGG